MKVAIVTIAYCCTEGLAHLPDCGSDRHELEFHVFLHSKHTATVNACARFSANPQVIYYPYGSNRGVSKSWNEGTLAAYARGADVVVITNDDIIFSPGDIDRIVAKAVLHRDNYILSCSGFHARFGRQIPSLGYSCFAINPIALEKLGCFDENIFPAYCEDQDYARRAQLASLNEENCADTKLIHAGSASIFRDPELARQNCVTQGRNIAYYRRKWGGDAGHENFCHPFNDSQFSQYISPERRDAPYGPPYDRSDHDIVKV